MENNNKQGIEVPDCNPGDPSALLFYPTLTENIPQSFFETAYSLFDLIRDKGTLSFEDALDLLYPVFECVTKLHQQGRIHGAISPDNILVKDHAAILKDPPLITDVIWPENLKNLKHGYAALEQYDMENCLGCHTDVYGLSAVLFFCLTGITPDSSLTRAVMSGNSDCIYYGSLDNDLRSVLQKGLALKPIDRIRTVDDLDLQLDRVLF